jgi:hypothetical protein
MSKEAETPDHAVLWHRTITRLSAGITCAHYLRVAGTSTENSQRDVRSDPASHLEVPEITCPALWVCALLTRISRAPLSALGVLFTRAPHPQLGAYILVIRNVR